jgi:electron transport complex protein RnfB
MKTKVCPVDAIGRRRISEFEFEYTVDEEKCIGCGKCVKRCWSHGNKSLTLQVRGKYCKECNRCRIVANCPYGAIRTTEQRA